jgi:hypothetical protein
MAEPMPAYEPEGTLVQLDDERHADLDLSHLGKPQHRRYRAIQQDDGTILLKPELSDEELEGRILADPLIISAIDEARANPERMRPRPERNH